jgi:hypothetical protein
MIRNCVFNKNLQVELASAAALSEGLIHIIDHKNNAFHVTVAQGSAPRHRYKPAYSQKSCFALAMRLLHSCEVTLVVNAMYSRCTSHNKHCVHEAALTCVINF